ncbi:MAG: DUF1624 domain-containing protein [Oscillospiraceae bacterium]|nr:DUF1624 domain-containing protein [Oscillospiraceae bacterium]
MAKSGTKGLQRERIGIMDDLRGLSVFCMVFYHAFYLLGQVFGNTWGNRLFDFFSPLQPIFAGIFIVISGVSCNLSRSNAKRGSKLLCIALAFSAITCLLLPRVGIDGLQIRFGILHLLSISMLLFALLRPALEKIPTTWGFAPFFVLYLLTYHLEFRKIGVPYLLEWDLPATLYQSHWLFPFGLRRSDFYSADYFPLMPYLFLFLAGTFLGKLPTPGWAKKTRARSLTFLGRHALIIYMAHQPVIMGLFAVVDWLLHK